MNLLKSPDLIDDVFCKVLTANDDSGRHGILIPVFAYWMFPDFESFVPGIPVNYEVPIITHWKESSGWVTKESKWKHYHRYPERRMTSLSPELLNEKAPGSLVLVAKLRGSAKYECLVISPQDNNYFEIGRMFKLNEVDGVLTGASIVPFSSLTFEANTQSIFDELLMKIKSISSMGYVKSLRSGDTGVGYTLETLLGIKANSEKDPDYKGIEVKSSRSPQIKQKRKVTTGKQTLFSLIPCWGVAKDRRGLVESFGVFDVQRERKALYCTIKVVPNSYGWSLEISEQERRIYINNGGSPIVYYDFEDLKKAIESKHKESVFVTAHARKNPRGEEEFHFDSVTHCKEVLFSEFLDMIKENLIGLDFAIHLKDGKVRDHGFLWRLENKKYLLRLFKYVQEAL